MLNGTNSKNTRRTSKHQLLKENIDIQCEPKAKRQQPEKRLAQSVIKKWGRRMLQGILETSTRRMCQRLVFAWMKAEASLTRFMWRNTSPFLQAQGCSMSGACFARTIHAEYTWKLPGEAAWLVLNVDTFKMWDAIRCIQVSYVLTISRWYFTKCSI